MRLDVLEIVGGGLRVFESTLFASYRGGVNILPSLARSATTHRRRLSTSPVLSVYLPAPDHRCSPGTGSKTHGHSANQLLSNAMGAVRGKVPSPINQISPALCRAEGSFSRFRTKRVSLLPVMLFRISRTMNRGALHAEECLDEHVAAVHAFLRRESVRVEGYTRRARVQSLARRRAALERRPDVFCARPAAVSVILFIF